MRVRDGRMIINSWTKSVSKMIRIRDITCVSVDWSRCVRSSHSSSGLGTCSETRGSIWVRFTRLSLWSLLPAVHSCSRLSFCFWVQWKTKANSVQSVSRWGSAGADLSNKRLKSWSYLDVEPAPVWPQTVVSHAGCVELKVINLQRLQTQRRTVCQERSALRNLSWWSVQLRVRDTVITSICSGNLASVLWLIQKLSVWLTSDSRRSVQETCLETVTILSEVTSDSFRWESY